MTVVTCADCSATFTCNTRNASQVSRCGECQTNHTRELSRLRNRLLRPGSVNGLPVYLSCHPRRCQICGMNEQSHTAPDGSDAPCCGKCFDDCLIILRNRRLGLRSVLVAEIAARIEAIALSYPEQVTERAEREVATTCPRCEARPKRVYDSGIMGSYCRTCTTEMTRESRARSRAVKLAAEKNFGQKSKGLAGRKARVMA